MMVKVTGFGEAGARPRRRLNQDTLLEDDAGVVEKLSNGRA